METIKIAHLYYDLMNLYGENGNVRVLVKHLEEQNVKVILHTFSLEDNIDFTKYDIFYIGCGNKDNFSLVLENIKHYQKEIKKAIKEGKFFLVTGTGLDLFGKSFTNLDGVKIKALDIFDYESKEIPKRLVGEQEFVFNGLTETILGFQNRNTILDNLGEVHLFEVITGYGYQEETHFEGIRSKNFYGTYLLGPILARNPYFTEYIVSKIMTSKGLEYHPYQNEYEIKAYKEYMKNVIKD